MLLTNIKETFFQYSVYDFSIVNVRFFESENEIAIVKARKCHLVKDKIDEEIFITSLPQSLNDQKCPSCVAILLGSMERSVLDSVTIVDKLLVDYFLDQLALSVYNARQKTDGKYSNKF